MTEAPMLRCNVWDLQLWIDWYFCFTPNDDDDDDELVKDLVTEIEEPVVAAVTEGEEQFRVRNINSPVSSGLDSLRTLLPSIISRQTSNDGKINNDFKINKSNNSTNVKSSNNNSNNNNDSTISNNDSKINNVNKNNDNNNIISNNNNVVINKSKFKNGKTTDDNDIDEPFRVRGSAPSSVPTLRQFATSIEDALRQALAERSEKIDNLVLPTVELESRSQLLLEDIRALRKKREQQKY
jgi:hypothetical protein